MKKAMIGLCTLIALLAFFRITNHKPIDWRGCPHIMYYDEPMLSPEEAVRREQMLVAAAKADSKMPIKAIRYKTE